MRLQTRHIANIITLTRIFGVGGIFLLTPYTTSLMQLWTIVIYTLICLTDFFDGWIARRFNSVSDLGKILDPLADKILVLVFLPLLQMQAITAFPVFIILAREFIVMAMRVLSAKHGVIVAARFSGKLKTAITLPICGILFARMPVSDSQAVPMVFKPLLGTVQWVSSWPSWAFSVLIGIMVLVTLWSLLDYLGSYMWEQALKKAGGKEEKAKQRLMVLIPNSITLLNLLCGCFSAVYALFGYFHMAVLLVLVGTLCDALDGKLARKLDAFTKFGAKLDSQADFTNFGIAPAVVIFSFLSNSIPWFFALILGVLYYTSVHYRLRRFDKGGHSAYFEGLPSPVGAGLVVLAAISTYLSPAYIFILIVFILEILMVSRIPYPHLDIFGKRRLGKLLAIPTALFLVLTILHLLQLNIASHIYAYEILFGTTSVYVIVAPFLKTQAAVHQES